MRALKERAREYLRWCVSQGILYLRSHVDTCHRSLLGARALVEVRDELRELIDVQLVAFPQHGFLRFPDGERLLDEALDLGVDSSAESRITSAAAKTACRASGC